MRSLLASWLPLALVAAAAPRPPAEAPDEDERPSLVLIVVDDWSYDDFALARTDEDPWNDLPNVERLAEAGQVWRWFHAQPVCNPSRVALLFGRATGRTTPSGCEEPGPRTPSLGTPTVASLLAEHGYATAAFGKWHLPPHPDPEVPWERAPAARGFGAWRAWNASNLGGHCGSSGYEDWHRVDDGVGARSTEYHTQAVAGAFIDWWSATEGPRFAWVAFQAPHQPLHRPPAALLPEEYPATESRRARFDAMLVALDAALGSMLAHVDLADTWVLVLADNGTPPAGALDGASDRVKGTTRAGGVNVPLIVAGPGVHRGTVEALGHVVDLPATLAELAGAAVPEGAFPDSRSLAGVLRAGGRGPREHLVCDHVSPPVRTRRNRIPPPRVHDVAVVMRDADTGHLFKGRWVRDLDGPRLRRELYDLTADPREEQGLRPEGPVHERLAAIYRETLERDDDRR